MSDVFFDELGIPVPDYHLGVGSGSHASQTANIMVGYEAYAREQKPDIVVVVGDVNSTLACSVVAKKMGISVAHVEAGLRSGDMNMPEEINRMVTDSISDLFYVTEPSGEENLLREGKPHAAIHFVGHVMIDNLLYEVNKLEDSKALNVTNAIKQDLQRYGVVTLHRPSNVDDVGTLAGIMDALNDIANELPLVFPVHPRTKAKLSSSAITVNRRIMMTDPLSFRNFLNLWKDAVLVLTDSGGLQEETTALSVPCLTLRENTERPVTITNGSNTLVGNDPDRIRGAAKIALTTDRVTYNKPEFWDGKAAERIVATLA